MSSASVSPHGFVTVRGRGYRPEQVDAYFAALSRVRDTAWERAARLTVLAKEMDAEVGRLREVVARLAPQTYETLGERACRIRELGEEEAAAVRENARSAARLAVEEAEAEGRRMREAAQAYADELRGEAEERARHRLLAARAEADEMRIAARRAVKEGRGEVLAALREVRQRTEGFLADQEREHAERWEEAERAAVERAAGLDAHHVKRGCAPRPRWPRPSVPSPRPRRRPGSSRKVRWREPLRCWPRPVFVRSGSFGRRSGCCASTGSGGTTYGRRWNRCVRVS